MSTKVGLCGFTIGASAYYETFDVVEVQQTFYDPPARATLERWRGQAPPHFEFTMKAWQVITHASTSRTYLRLKSPFTDGQRSEAGGFRVNGTTMDAWQMTLRCARLLRATCILFQCPASFRATVENADAMRSFFGSIDRPAGIRFLWEPRGAWPDDLIADLCGELGLYHAVDPFIRRTVTPSFTYLRLHGNGSSYASYTDEELRRLRGWLAEGSEAYVMFNNIPRTADAQRFRALIAEQSL